jgi:hypothetical protein
VHTRGICSVDPQFLREALRAFEVSGVFETDAPGMGLAAARAFGFTDQNDCRPAFRAEIEVFLRKNSDTALPAECGQEKVLETQNHTPGEQPADRMRFLNDRLCHL